MNYAFESSTIDDEVDRFQPFLWGGVKFRSKNRKLQAVDNINSIVYHVRKRQQLVQERRALTGARGQK